MNKNTVGFVLSIVLLFGAYFAYMSGQIHTQGSQSPTAVTDAKVANSTASKNSDSPAAGQPEAQPTAEQPAHAEPQQASEQQTAPASPLKEFSTENSPAQLSLESQDLLLTINSKGGCVEKAVLKNYIKAFGSEEKLSVFDKLEPCRALGFKLGTFDLREQPALIGQEAGALIAEQRAAGIHIRRTIRLPEAGYSGSFEIELTNVSETPQSQLLEFEIGATSSSAGSQGFLHFDQSQMRKVAYYANDKRHEEVLKFEETPSSKVLIMEPNLNLTWAGSGGTYFLFALAPRFAEAMGVRVERQPFNMQPNRQSPPERTIYEGWLQQNLQLGAGESKKFDFSLYLGPKKLDELQAAGHKLDESINYGFFQIIAWPMFKVLKAIEGVVGNWGIAIIFLTLVIRLLFYPLTAKSYAASKKMQKLQPKMNELKELYKDDKQKQQQELMALMSKEGVNPLGGCLPVLPQIPVFFGLNAVLMNTFDLRLAPFGLWIHDLSAKDPYYVSAVIMAGLMYLQQSLTPMPGVDPAQAKMMRFLPIVFALFMVTYPSGLVVYIITSTLFSIAQQQFMMRRYKDV